MIKLCLLINFKPVAIATGLKIITDGELIHF